MIHKRYAFICRAVKSLRMYILTGKEKKNSRDVLVAVGS
nr:MAG TPA: hypothetical protein [Caudoviricetes sp.]